MPMIKNAYTLVVLLGGLLENVVVFDNEKEAIEAAEDVVVDEEFHAYEDDAYVFKAPDKIIWQSDIDEEQ